MITIPVSTLWLFIGWALGVATVMVVAAWYAARSKKRG